MARRGRDDCPLPSPALPDNTLSGQWASRDTVRVIDVVRLPDGATRRGSSHRYLGRASCGRTEKRGDDLERTADSVGGAARPWQPLLSTDTGSTCSPPTPPYRHSAGPAQATGWQAAEVSAVIFSSQRRGKREKTTVRLPNFPFRQRRLQTSLSEQLQLQARKTFGFPLFSSYPVSASACVGSSLGVCAASALLLLRLIACLLVVVNHPLRFCTENSLPAHKHTHTHYHIHNVLFTRKDPNFAKVP